MRAHPAVLDLETLPYRRKRERVSIKSLTGERSQLCLVRLEPGERTCHAHAEEQLGLVLSGRADLTVGEQRHTVGTGWAFCIPPNVPHGFDVCHGCAIEYVEVFVPPKPENALP